MPVLRSTRISRRSAGIIVALVVGSLVAVAALAIYVFAPADGVTHQTEPATMTGAAPALSASDAHCQANISFSWFVDGLNLTKADGGAMIEQRLDKEVVAVEPHSQYGVHLDPSTRTVSWNNGPELHNVTVAVLKYVTSQVMWVTYPDHAQGSITLPEWLNPMSGYMVTVTAYSPREHALAQSNGVPGCPAFTKDVAAAVARQAAGGGA
jgi:hypothetical protein